MHGVSQTFHTAITSDEVNERLAKGARVVALSRKEGREGLWDAVLEAEIEDMGETAVILEFLGNVDPGALERQMLNYPTLDVGPGTCALLALSEMATRGT